MSKKISRLKEIFLPEMNREQVKKAVSEKAVLMIPVAAIEQHGPHLPLQTDMDNVNNIVLKVAEKLDPNPRIVVSTPISFSPSPFDPKMYPGSIAMRTSVYKEVLSDILVSYLRGGFKKIVVVNGHGAGTERWIPEVVLKLNKKQFSMKWVDGWEIPPEAQVVALYWFSFIGQFALNQLRKIRQNPSGSDWHAGDIETSLQLYLRPDLVNMHKARKGAIIEKGDFCPRDLIENQQYQFLVAGYRKKFEEGGMDGVYGDPTHASKELGKKILNLAANTISAFIEEFAASEPSFPLSNGMCDEL